MLSQFGGNYIEFQRGGEEEEEEGVNDGVDDVVVM